MSKLCQNVVVDTHRQLALMMELIEQKQIRCTIEFGPWSDEFSDGWHWVLNAECPDVPEGPRAA
jgi:hypothetical protein